MRASQGCRTSVPGSLLFPFRKSTSSLGVKLFERHRNGCALTAAGKEMAVLAERMDEDVANFTRKLAGQALTPAGELRVTSEVRSAQALSLERGLQRAPCVLRGRRLAAAPQHE